ncbi:MAG: ATP-dependent Clp protease ATP-binding subunit ClpX, partial [Ruminococcaceae bacterium]|nr:ATP-dependent Clp protease ATP-binding subunit ClpX [Oscillospiraceae bacterium]
MAKREDHTIRCSFCGKGETQGVRMVAGPGVYICSDCVLACSDLLFEDLHQQPAEDLPERLPTPVEIKTFMDHYIIGQEEAK